MRPFYKKMLFLEAILCYVILIFAVQKNLADSGDSVFVSLIQRDSDEEEVIDSYKELPKKVALTFDDGPNADYTELLLAGLEERGVSATFFLLGKEVEKYPEIVKDIYADGHLIGIHAYEHVNLSRLSDSAAAEQVNKTNTAIFSITGEQPKYIRPPFGSWKKNLDIRTSTIQVLWDIDPLDWKSSNSRVVARRVLDKVQENDIILMHDASESSVKAAFLIIDELEREGYEFVTVEDILFD